MTTFAPKILHRVAGGLDIWDRIRCIERIKMIPSQAIMDHEYDVIIVDGSGQAIEDAKQWCRDNFGPEGKRWFTTYKKFYFYNNKDAMWFELRY